MTEQGATIDDYRLFGTRFGVECAAAAKRKHADGESREQIRAHVVDGMIPVKDAQLRQIGANDAEIDSFMRAAGAATYAALNGVDLLGGGQSPPATCDATVVRSPWRRSSLRLIMETTSVRRSSKNGFFED